MGSEGCIPSLLNQWLLPCSVYLVMIGHFLVVLKNILIHSFLQILFFGAICLPLEGPQFFIVC